VTGEEVAWIEAIRLRLAACTQAGDARKADAYADSFAPEGVLDLTDGGGTAIEGREAIRAWMKAPSVFLQQGGASPGFISHHLTTCSITLASRTEATARTYWLVTSAAGIDHNGYYDDRLVRIGSDWLLAWRKPRTLWTSPTSVLHSRGG